MKILKFNLLLIATLALLASCGGSGESSETSADTTAMEEDTTVTTETSMADPAEYGLDTSASSLTWTGKKVVGDSHTGSIAISEGTLMMQGDDLIGGSLTVDMSTLTNEDLEDPEQEAKLLGHLKSPDFFAVDSFPTASFQITEVSKMEDAMEVKGDLTIKGVTNPATATAKMEGGKLVGSMVFDRAKYNVRYGSDSFFDDLGDKVISDEVTLDFKLTPKMEEETAM